MPINEKDRHVLAAAVSCGANIIVTQNLKDFPNDILAHYKVEAQSADKFLLQLFQVNAASILLLLIQQAKDLRNPPMTTAGILNALEQHIPVFVERMRNEFGI